MPREILGIPEYQEQALLDQYVLIIILVLFFQHILWYYVTILCSIFIDNSPVHSLDTLEQLEDKDQL